MTSVGMFIAAIIIWFEITVFACLMKLVETSVFYLVDANRSGQFLSEKISEGE